MNVVTDGSGCEYAPFPLSTAKLSQSLMTQGLKVCSPSVMHSLHALSVTGSRTCKQNAKVAMRVQNWYHLEKPCLRLEASCACSCSAPRMPHTRVWSRWCRPRARPLASASTLARQALHSQSLPRLTRSATPLRRRPKQVPAQCVHASAWVTASKQGCPERHDALLQVCSGAVCPGVSGTAAWCLPRALAGYHSIGGLVSRERETASNVRGRHAGAEEEDLGGCAARPEDRGGPGGRMAGLPHADISGTHHRSNTFEWQHLVTTCSRWPCSAPLSHAEMGKDRGRILRVSCEQRGFCHWMSHTAHRLASPPQLACLHSLLAPWLIAPTCRRPGESICIPR